MQYDELFDRETLTMMSEAQRNAQSRNKPAITSLMAAKVFIDRDSAMSQRVFDEMHLNLDTFKRMADREIDQMPTVSEATPFVDDELDRIVRESILRDDRGRIIAGSVTAEALLRLILREYQGISSVSVKARLPENSLPPPRRTTC